MLRLVELMEVEIFLEFNILCDNMLRKKCVDDDDEEMCEWMMIRKSEIEK